MKLLRESPWLQRGLCFLAGTAVTLICDILQFWWMDLVPYHAFDLQPPWLKTLKGLVGWLPWIALAIVLVLRLTRGAHFRVGAYFLGTVTPIVLLVGWLIFGSSIEDWMHRQSFDAEAWREQESGEHDTMWPPRLCMVDDLLSRRRLVGMTRTEVINLLGPPAEKGFPFGAAECDIHYYLGPERGLFRIDSEWLLLKFGEDGKLNRQWLYRD